VHAVGPAFDVQVDRPFLDDGDDGELVKVHLLALDATKSNAQRGLASTSRNSTHVSGRPKQLWKPTENGLLAES
jgi:hypothetical protein